MLMFVNGFGAARLWGCGRYLKQFLEGFRMLLTEYINFTDGVHGGPEYINFTDLQDVGWYDDLIL